MNLRNKIKQGLLAFPRLWAAYQSVKSQLKRLWLLRYFVKDISTIYRNMHWPSHDLSPLQLTSALLFQYHKLEKGLVMPGPKRFFGEDPARTILDLLEKWHSKGLSLNDPVYLGALETLHAYRDRLESESLDKEDRVLSTLRTFLHKHPARSASLSTPQPLARLAINETNNIEAFEQLVAVRRSVRSFATREVPRELIERAVSLAQLSPSACNRQPCRVYFVTDENRKRALLALQNGNRGFGHLIPTVAVITADSGAFFDASERHEPFVDGGLFSMSLMYALSAQGLATCCLNWCVSPGNDDALRGLVPLADGEVVIMLMAIGYPEPDVLVPKSPRKLTERIMVEVY